jgi:hypothetical protein
VFGDHDLPRLRGFRYLDSLDVSDTQVTNAGLAVVGDFSNLRHLTVSGNQITSKRQRGLQAEIPRLVIEKLWLINGMKVMDGYQ